MIKAGAMPGLQLVRQGNTAMYFKPHAYVFSSAERVLFLNTMSSIQAPTLYNSSFTRHVDCKKLSGLKSHEYQVLMQEILLACLRTSLHPRVQNVVIRMCTCFKRICAKEFTIAEMQELDAFVAETMALVEIWFPPAFFDIMTHLVVHLPRQLAIYRLVHSQWMYDTERYMGVLKSMCYNRSNSEASICNVFLKDETLDFVSTYLPGFKPSA